jgi:hypothetical protein
MRGAAIDVVLGRWYTASNHRRRRTSFSRVEIVAAGRMGRMEG